MATATESAMTASLVVHPAPAYMGAGALRQARPSGHSRGKVGRGCSGPRRAYTCAICAHDRDSPKAACAVRDLRAVDAPGCIRPRAPGGSGPGGHRTGYRGVREGTARARNGSTIHPLMPARTLSRPTWRSLLSSRSQVRFVPPPPHETPARQTTSASGAVQQRKAEIASLRIQPVTGRDALTSNQRQFVR